VPGQFSVVDRAPGGQKMSRTPRVDVYCYRRSSGQHEPALFLQSRNSRSRSSGIVRKKAEWLKPHHFKPGQSGNPGGRPPKPITDALTELANEVVPGDKLKRTYAQKATQAVWDKATKGDVRSFEVIADRIEGKVQSGELVASVTTNVNILNAEKTEELRVLLERLRDMRAARELEGTT
jgi:hypothetical protein